MEKFYVHNSHTVFYVLSAHVGMQTRNQRNHETNANVKLAQLAMASLEGVTSFTFVLVSRLHVCFPTDPP